MKQKLISISIAVMMVICMATIVMADHSAISIAIDNREIEFTSDSGFPFVDENGRTLVPLRVVMEEYGCKVLWDKENNSAIISKGRTEVIVPIGKSYIIVDGKNVTMDTSAVIVENRTYLPIRAVLEAFGADVEWDNGKITVTSKDNHSFDNICIDDNGDIVFELANGETIILGNINEDNTAVSVVNAEINASGNLIISLSDGKNINAGKVSNTGVQNTQIIQNVKDGVSVTDAYVDRDGDLIIVLSNGKSINAGNVRSSGSSVSQLTFEDYPVGTKFYLTMPTGQFDVPVKVDGVSYTVSVENIYYELSEKYDANDEEAWDITDGSTTFAPYVLTFYAECSTDDDLAGAVIEIGICYNGTIHYISGKADHNGTLIAEKTYNTVHTPPSDVTFYKIEIVPETDPATYFSALVGKWVSFSNDTLTYFTVNSDGSITYNGVTYDATYSSNISETLITAKLSDGKTIRFYSEDNHATLGSLGSFSYSYYPELKDFSPSVGEWYSLNEREHNLNVVLTVADNGSFVYDGTTYYPEIYQPAGEDIIALTDDYTFKFNETCVFIYDSDGDTIDTVYPETKDISHLTGKYHNNDDTIILNEDGTIVYDGTTYPIAVVYIKSEGYYAQIQVGSEMILFGFYDKGLRVNGDNYYYKEISDISMIVGDWHAIDVNGDGIYPSVDKITVNSDGTIVYGDIIFYDVIYYGDIIANTGSMCLIFEYRDPLMWIDGEEEAIYSKT